MKYASICSGIEAASVAWHPLGWTPVLFSEIEPFPCAVLAERFPGVPNLGDMTAYRNWPEELLAEVDVLVGGTPCQAFSVAGKRQSLGDERGNLTLVFVNIWRRINEVRRKHGRRDALVVWENVPGVLNTKDNAFGCLLGAFLGLDEAPETEAGRWPVAGFLAGEAARVGWRILDAQFFGLAQRRRRVFLVASTGEPVGGAGAGPCPAEVLALRESRPGDPPPSRQAGKELAGAAGSGASASGWPADVASTLNAHFGEKQGLEDQHAQHGAPLFVPQAPFVKARRAQNVEDYETWVDGGVTPTLNAFDASEVRSTTLVTEPHAFYSTGGTRGLNPEAGASPPIKVGSDLGIPSPHAVAYRWQNDREGLVNDGTAPSMRASSGSSGFHEMNHPVVVQQPAAQAVAPLFIQDDTTPKVSEERAGCLRRDAGGEGACVMTPAMQVRRLTPRECERLQGFPDDWTLIGYRGKPASECPDGPRYKAIGNSMAVPCMAWIGRQINKATGGKHG